MYGKILRVDLSNENIFVEDIPKAREWKRKYWGGEALNDRLLWEHYMRVDPDIDPLDKDSVLIAGVGPLGATGALGAGTKVKWTFKSPIYGGFGDAVGGGFFGSQLRWAGYDHLVITGKAERPVYVWIKDDDIEIRDAIKFWGKDVHRSDDLIRETIGDQEAQSAVIGPAGENLVRFANIMMSRNRSASRTGGGCVMGSKNLKAIVARGTKGVRIADPQEFLAVTLETYPEMLNSPGWQISAKQGMPFLVSHYQRHGAHPWKNHQSTMIPEDVYPKVNARYLLQHFKTRDSACSAGCAMACTNWWKIKDDGTTYGKKYEGEVGEKPEYLTMAAMMAWGADQMASYCHTQKLWDTLGVDATEMGASVGFLMHLYEMKIIDDEDVKAWIGESRPLSWGDTAMVQKITESLVYRQNKLYELLKDGLYEAARKIERSKGINVMQYVRYGAKHSPEPEDVRNRRTWTLAMATATRGADHLKALTTVELLRLTGICEEICGSPIGVDSRNPHLKGIIVAWDENRMAGMNATGLCIFNTPSAGYLGPGLDIYARCHKALTGEEADDLMTVGERTYNMERAFNALFGHARKDDTLCDQWMREPIPKGLPGEGMKGEDCFDLMMDEYYGYRGMDPDTGLQTRTQLETLGLKEIADILEKRGALSSVEPKARDKIVAEAREKAEKFQEKLSSEASPQSDELVA